MGRQPGNTLSPDTWQHIRDAVKLYDDSAKFTLTWSKGKFLKRADGTYNMRARAIRLILLMVYGEQIGKKALANRLGKCSEAVTKRAATTRRTQHEQLVSLNGAAVGAAPDTCFRDLPAPEETYRIDYLIKPQASGVVSIFEPVGTSTLLCAEEIPPQLCEWEVRGASLFDLNITLDTQWMLNKTATVSVQEEPVRRGREWSVDALFPPALEFGEASTKRYATGFPLLAANYIHMRNPSTTTFVWTVTLHNHSLFMNTVLAHLCTKVAPIRKLEFAFRFDTSRQQTQGFTMELPAPELNDTPPTPPWNQFAVVAEGQSTDVAVANIPVSGSTFEDGLVPVVVADSDFEMEPPSTASSVDTAISSPSASDADKVADSIGHPIPVRMDGCGLQECSPHESCLPSTSAPQAGDPLAVGADLLASNDCVMSDPDNDDQGDQSVHRQLISDVVHDAYDEEDPPMPEDCLFSGVLSDRGRYTIDGNPFIFLLDAVPRYPILEVPRPTVLTPVPYTSWEVGRFQRPNAGTSVGATLSYDCLFRDSEIWFPSYVSSYETSDVPTTGIQFVHQFA